LSCHCVLQFGQLGVGKGDDRPLPVGVTALADEPIAQAACGWRHTTVVSVAGKVYSWGRGCCGQLGHGDLEDKCGTLRSSASSWP
jgi:alpha-tubulin suppressor-like RCC1 family protein